jgi:hypothetical protein
MLFRNVKGELIEINKYDFVNDKLYYEKITELHSLFAKQVILSKLMPSSKKMVDKDLKKTLNNKNK